MSSSNSSSDVGSYVFSQDLGIPPLGSLRGLVCATVLPVRFFVLACAGVSLGLATVVLFAGLVIAGVSFDVVVGLGFGMPGFMVVEPVIGKPRDGCPARQRKYSSCLFTDTADERYGSPDRCPNIRM
jgi:hypothetical protein